MSYQSATTQCPADADLLAYRNLTTWVVLRRDEDGFSVIANVCDAGFDLIVAGASAQRKALWNWEHGRFETGTVEQLSREA